MEDQKTIGIVVSSTRPQRICREIAEWVLGIVQADSLLGYELIDLAEINLPFLDEPLIPALGQYQHEHTKAWSRLVNAFTGFIFVLPQYNWGYPAPLKNALDFLYAEWADKPAGIVTYGARGGGKAADALKVVLQGLHMQNTATNPALSFTKEMIGEDGHFKDISSDFSDFASMIQEMDVEITQLLGT